MNHPLCDRWRTWLANRHPVAKPRYHYRVVIITETSIGDFRRGPKQRLEIKRIPKDNQPG